MAYIKNYKKGFAITAVSLGLLCSFFLFQNFTELERVSPGSVESLEKDSNSFDDIHSAVLNSEKERIMHDSSFTQNQKNEHGGWIDSKDNVAMISEKRDVSSVTGKYSADVADREQIVKITNAIKVAYHAKNADTSYGQSCPKSLEEIGFDSAEGEISYIPIWSDKCAVQVKVGSLTSVLENFDQYTILVEEN